MKHHVFFEEGIAVLCLWLVILFLILGVRYGSSENDVVAVVPVPVISTRLAIDDRAMLTNESMTDMTPGEFADKHKEDK